MRLRSDRKQNTIIAYLAILLTAVVFACFVVSVAFLYSSGSDFAYVASAADEHTHSDMDYVPALSATCTQNGNQSYYQCSCGKQFYDSNATREVLDYFDIIIMAKGHTPLPVVIENDIAATCTAEGHRDEVVYCLVCENEVSRTQIIINKLDHIFVNDICTNCGITVSQAHVCNHKCDTCGKCENPDCTYDACAKKCEGHTVIIDISSARGFDFRYEYTGEEGMVFDESKFVYSATYGGETLAKDVDYTVSYLLEERVSGVWLTVTVSGMGNYTGEMRREFIINALPQAPEPPSEIAEVTINLGALIGSVCAIVVVIATILTIVLCIRNKRRKRDLDIVDDYIEGTVEGYVE